MGTPNCISHQERQPDQAECQWLWVGLTFLLRSLGLGLLVHSISLVTSNSQVKFPTYLTFIIYQLRKTECIYVYRELCCNRGCSIKPEEITPAEISGCFIHISTSVFNVLDYQDFKEPFYSRLGQGEISNFPRDKFSPALPDTIAGTEYKFGLLR